MEDEVRDAMGICEWNKLSDMAIAALLAELRLKAHVGDEALKGFEELADQSVPPITFLDMIRFWTFDDWKDWLKGD